jgi:hypothetical protein
VFFSLKNRHAVTTREMIALRKPLHRLHFIRMVCAMPVLCEWHFLQETADGFCRYVSARCILG